MLRWLFIPIHVQAELTMPATTMLEMPASEQDRMLVTLRRAQYGYLLALHVLLLKVSALR